MGLGSPHVNLLENLPERAKSGANGVFDWLGSNVVQHSAKRCRSIPVLLSPAADGFSLDDRGCWRVHATREYPTAAISLKAETDPHPALDVLPSVSRAFHARALRQDVSIADAADVAAARCDWGGVPNKRWSAASHLVGAASGQMKPRRAPDRHVRAQPKNKKKQILGCSVAF